MVWKSKTGFAGMTPANLSDNGLGFLASFSDSARGTAFDVYGAQGILQVEVSNWANIFAPAVPTLTTPAEGFAGFQFQVFARTFVFSRTFDGLVDKIRESGWSAPGDIVPEPIPIPEEDITVFVNVFNSAGDIISSGPMLMSNVLRLRAAGQRVDIIEEAEVDPVETPDPDVEGTFFRLPDGTKILFSDIAKVEVSLAT